jgi:hypothetical protein
VKRLPLALIVYATFADTATVKTVKLLPVQALVLLLGVALDVSAASEYRILSDCDPSADIRATISKDAKLQIHFALAGASTCYSVTATVDGKQVRGYVLNGDLDAVLEFDKARLKVSREALNAPQVVPPTPAPISTPAAAASDGKKPADGEKPAAAEKSASGETSAEKTPKETPRPQGPLDPLR